MSDAVEQGMSSKTEVDDVGSANQKNDGQQGDVEKVNECHETPNQQDGDESNEDEADDDGDDDDGESEEYESHPTEKSTVSQALSVSPPTASSRIVLRTSSNFSSLRIQASGTGREESGDAEKQLLEAIPMIGQRFSHIAKVGEGTFSKVFKVRLKSDQSKQFALKYVTPTTKPSRIAKEIRFLRDLGGTDNIIRCITSFFNYGHTVIVMDYFPHDKFSDVARDLSLEEIRDYIKNLLVALRKVHSLSIIHRDVKPNNFLYDRKSRRYCLVDFGLSQTTDDVLHHKAFVSKSYAITMCKSYQAITQQSRVLKESEKATTNSVMVKGEAKQFLIRKRSIQEKEKERNTKRQKMEHPFSKPSALVDTPDTSSTRCTRTDDVFKTPTKRLPNDCTKENSACTPVVEIVPETPPKTIRANKLRLLSDTTVKNHAEITPKTKKAKIMAAKELYCRRLNRNCTCFSKSRICKGCMHKDELNAPRAGTPGYRAPEVLLKSLVQTSAIDVWAVGVIFASLLSKRHPFFRNCDDMTSLAEIITVMGSKRVTKAAKDMNKVITISMDNKPALNLKIACEKLRGVNPEQVFAPESAYDLLDQLIDPNPNSRIIAEQALKHSFFNSDIS